MVFDQKLMAGWGEHKVVLDESGFRACAADSDWGLNFLSVGLRVAVVLMAAMRC